jgi:hypothetical protein
MTAGETHRAIEATFRIERARLVAGLARGDLELANERTQTCELRQTRDDLAFVASLTSHRIRHIKLGPRGVMFS